MQQWIFGSLHKHMREGRNPEQVWVHSPPFLLMVYLSLYLCICAKKWKCATRLSSSGLPSLGDPCRPRWERGPCRGGGAGGAGSAAQPTKQVAPEGKGRRKRNIWVDELLKSRLELGRCNCQRFEPGRRQLLCSHRSHQVGRGTQVARLRCFLFFLISVLFRLWPPQCNAWAFVRQSW